jgi:dsRNA-specific ribonuclease
MGNDPTVVGNALLALATLLSAMIAAWVLLSSSGHSTEDVEELIEQTLRRLGHQKEQTDPTPQQDAPMKPTKTPRPTISVENSRGRNLPRASEEDRSAGRVASP